ncbi:MAG: DUF364 domain-containing protein [Burkholderiaceae bacterium]
MTSTPISDALMAQLDAIHTSHPVPAIAGLHFPSDLRTPSTGARDAAFCAIELQDGAFGLSYLLLGDTLRKLLSTGAGTGPLEGQDPLTLARRFGSNDTLQRALALACINALTDSVWRRIGYQPPPAGNSLGDVVLSGADHLGMIGFFPPLVRQVQALGCRLTVVELDPAMVLRQQARFPDVDITLDRSRLAECNVVVGTSTMLLNDTLDAMLAAAPRAQQFAVIGPSAGLWPDALFARGVTLMGGTRIVDGPGFRTAMASGASWSPCARKFALSAGDWPGWRKLLS